MKCVHLTHVSFVNHTQDPREEVSDTVNHLTFNYTAGSFFQNNAYVLPHMVSYVVGKAKATNLRYLVDAYCGGGLFCLSASRDFEVSRLKPEQISNSNT